MICTSAGKSLHSSEKTWDCFSAIASTRSISFATWSSTLLPPQHHNGPTLFNVCKTNSFLAWSKTRSSQSTLINIKLHLVVDMILVTYNTSKSRAITKGDTPKISVPIFSTLSNSKELQRRIPYKTKLSWHTELVQKSTTTTPSCWYYKVADDSPPFRIICDSAGFHQLNYEVEHFGSIFITPFSLHHALTNDLLYSATCTFKVAHPEENFLVQIFHHWISVPFSSVTDMGFRY